MASIAELSDNSLPLSPEESTPQQALPGEKRPLPRGTASYPRKRAVTACQVCRARRTKCDNRKPSCSFCLKVGAHCIQSPVDLSSFDPASLKILERLDELESALGRCQATVESIKVRDFDVPASSASEFLHRPRDNRIEDIDCSKLLPQCIEAIRQWTALGLQNEAVPEPQPEQSVTSPTEVDIRPSTSFIDELQPQFTTLLLNNFFQYVHVKNPVLNEPLTRRMVARLCLDGLDWSPESCLALLALALGAMATPFQYHEMGGRDAETFAYAKLFYKAAQKRFGTVIGSGKLIEAQCFFLSGVYMMTTFQRDTAWRFFLQALTCCQGFGFLRDSMIEKERDLNTGEGNPLENLQGRQSLTAEQTIYWSAWKSERELRGDMQLPDFTLSQAELAIYPLFFPTPPLLDDDSISGIGDDEVQCRERLAWYFYLSEISLRRLSSCIANGIVQFQPSSGESFWEGLAKATSIHEAQAEEWALTLPRIVSVECPPEEDDICRFVLRGHLINLYEIIYWPFVYASINGAQFDGGANAQCGLLLQSLSRKGLQKHVERLLINRPGFKHRHHGTPCLLRSCSRSALILMAAASSIHARLDRGLSLILRMPSGWQQAVLLAIEMNHYWEAESADSRYLLGLLRSAWEKVEHLNI